MVSGRCSAAYDRVVERRRAVALARHFRETEGLSIAQIADRLGRSPATIKAYFATMRYPAPWNQGPSACAISGWSNGIATAIGALSDAASEAQSLQSLHRFGGLIGNVDRRHHPLRTYVRTMVKPGATACGRRPILLLASAVGRIVGRMVALDRVQERHRAVALARHYRDQEGLLIAEIARRLGRAEGHGEGVPIRPV